MPTWLLFLTPPQPVRRRPLQRTHPPRPRLRRLQALRNADAASAANPATLTAGTGIRVTRDITIKGTVTKGMAPKGMATMITVRRPIRRLLPRMRPSRLRRCRNISSRLSPDQATSGPLATGTTARKAITGCLDPGPRLLMRVLCGPPDIGATAAAVLRSSMDIGAGM